MTKVPKVLYHGTTALRYTMMKLSGKMDSHTQKYYLCDGKIDGYLYFTDNLKEAVLFGFNTCLTDLRMNESQLRFVRMYDRDVRFKDAVALALRTSQLKDGIEVDPEHYSVNQVNIEHMRAQFLAEQNYNALDTLLRTESIWYRYKGDIPYKYIMPYRYIPFSYIEEQPGMLDTLNKGLDFTKLLDVPDSVVGE